MKKIAFAMIVLMLAKNQDVKRPNSFIGYREKHVVESEYKMKY